MKILAYLTGFVFRKTLSKIKKLASLPLLKKESVICFCFFSIPFLLLSQSYDEYLARGRVKEEKKDYKGAIIEYQKAVALNENIEEAYFRMGLTKYKLGDIAGAIQDFQKGLQISPSFGRYYVLALYQEKNKEFRNSLFSTNKAIELSNIRYPVETLDLSSLDLFSLRARLHVKLNDYPSALTDYNLAISFFPNEGYLYGGRADVKFYTKNYREALDDYVKWFDLLPRESDGEIRFWFRDQEKNALNGQLKILNKLLVADPNDVDVIFQRGFVKIKLKDYIGAVHDYSKVISLEEDAIAYLNRGIAKAGADDFRGAILDYNKAILLSPKTSDAFFLRAESKFSLEDFNGAIQDYTIALRLNPNDVPAYEYRGIAKIKLGQKESGCLDLSKAGELGSTTSYEMIRKHCN